MKKRKGGRAEYKKAKELTAEIAGLAEIPGALEMLVTMAAEKGGGPGSGGNKQLRLFNIGGAVKYADGGLAQAAEMTRQGGRGDDEMLLHLAPEEYEAITSMWGEPDVNPNTGIPEYGFLSKLWKGVKNTVKKVVKSPLFSFVAPMALNVFAPGLGSALGGVLGATGKTAAVLGNTLIRGGIGAVGGGKTGAVSGVLSGLTSGGVGSKIGSKLGLGAKTGKIAGDALLGGAAGEATGAGFSRGATGQALASLAGNPMQRLEQGLTDKARGFFRPGVDDVTAGSMSLDPSAQDPFGYGAETLPQTTAGGAVLSGGATTQTQPGFLSRAGDWIKEHPYLTAGGALLAGGALMGGGGGGRGDAPPQLPGSFTQSLPNLSFDREAMPIQDYYNYGRADSAQPGEASFFSNNVIPSTVPTAPSGFPGGAYPFVGAYKLGGLVRKYQSGGHVRGAGTGRSDEIPAVLSDGEYVIDSESVALLGDGSTDAGADRLDQMRDKLRKHKGRKLSKGGFSDAARTPEEYLAKGGKVKKGAFKDLKRLANRLELAVSSGNKKRVSEITTQLRAHKDGSKVLEGFAKGGTVAAVLRTLERNIDNPDVTNVTGPKERRTKARREKAREESKGRRSGEALTAEEKAELAREMGGFTKSSRFIRNLKRDLKKAEETR